MTSFIWFTTYLWCPGECLAHCAIQFNNYQRKERKEEEREKGRKEESPRVSWSKQDNRRKESLIEKHTKPSLGDI